MKRVLLCSLVTLLSFGICRAEEASVRGYGVVSCAIFGQAYKTNPDEAEETYFAWALGFMSGINLIAKVQHLQRRDLMAMSSEDQKHFIRKWCSEHQFNHYYEAVAALVFSLPVMTEDRGLK